MQNPLRKLQRRKTMRTGITALLLPMMLVGAGCSPFSKDPIAGPDKQSVGTWYGAATGAGAGAITGAEISAATGPGAWIGASFGAIFGMLSGLGLDLVEEDELRREEERMYLQQTAWVQEVLAEHYERRMELHPNRDIFPADWFFEGDAVTLRPGADLLAKGLAEMTKRRLPTSRIVIAAYTTSDDPDATYPRFLSKRRAEALANQFVRSGIEARRLSVRPMTLKDPILIDPEDSATRYRQAIEIIPLDR